MNDECSDPQVNDAAPVGKLDPHKVPWFGFDTENDETGKVTLAALVSESGDSSVWNRAGKMKEWCERRADRGQAAIVICHNLEYDLVNELGPHEYATLGLNYLKGRLISARWGPIKFLDSYNHFRMRLADIGDAIGIKKGEMDINNPEYVKQDSWICLKAMTQARDYISGLGGKIGATSGSSALSVWEYMTDGEFFTGPFDTKWLRQGYYGGRTEIFRRNTVSPYFPEFDDPFDRNVLLPTVGARDWKCPDHWFRQKLIRGYDINSMYPYCMMDNYPEYYMPDDTFSKAKGMVELTISIPHDIKVAPLCYRSPKGDLTYPVGVIRGTWTYDEIRLAESMGGKILKVHKAVGGNSMVRPFDQFITTLFEKRKASTNEAERLFLKVLMNALYGKIASKNEVTRTVSRHHLLKSKSKRIDEVKWITYHRGLLDYHTPQQPYVNVLWGSMITAYSRNLLHYWMSKVPDDRLIYSDTDSIYTYDFELPVSKELGQMKLEKTAAVMKVVQPKAYQIDDFFRAKGVPRPRESKDGLMVDFAQQYIEAGFVEFQAPIRFRDSINSHRGKANEWVMHKKSRKTAYGAKLLSGERYLPPLVGHQQELFSADTKLKGRGKAMTR